MSTKTLTQEEFANLSDDEILNMTEMPQVLEAEAPAPEEDVEEVSGSTPEEDVDAAPADAAADTDVLADDDTTLETGSEETRPEAGVDPKSEAQPETEAQPAKEAVTPAATIDYEAEYKRIMAPFKASGKEIKLESVDEVIRLMQMGADYTKKLQALHPKLRMLKMMENNGLLDEGKLSYLIDLDKKNPQAIQKLIKESGVDPLDIDASAEPNYKPENYRVSDEEVRFQSVLDEIMLDPVGQKAVLTINKTWDVPSQQALGKDPDILRAITEHMQNGIYDTISAELDRRRMLGVIRPEVPFINAYLAVGKDLDERGVLTPQKPAAVQQPSRVVETRPAPRKTVVNNDKARAASPVSSTPKKPGLQDYNPLSMSDEEFEKNQELLKRL